MMTMHYEITTLYTKEQKDKMVTLLNQQGIRLDQNIEYSCGVFNDKMVLLF